MSFVFSYSLSYTGRDENGFPLNVLPRYRHKGYFWYISQLLSYIMRPNKCFETIILEKKLSAGWERLEHPALSMHIRHGDSCSDTKKNRRCDPLNVYMNKAVIPMTKK